MMRKMDKPVATLFLQRNLPDVTNEFGERFLKNNGDISDFYVIESGSDDDQLSMFTDTTFHANWDDARQRGLHFPRGFNFGLLELKKLGLRYEHIFLCMGDTHLADEPTVEILLEEMHACKNIGIIAPISEYHGDTRGLVGTRLTRAHWLLPHVCWLFRSDLIDLIAKQNGDQTITGYLYDGTNMRGYDTDTLVLIQAYQNDFAFCVTDRVKFSEISDLTEKNYERMKTEKFSTHLDLMFEEGLGWLKKKYGFDGKQPMRTWAKSEYEAFFIRHPELMELKYDRR